MKLHGKEKLMSFIRKHADAKNWIECWIADVESSTWSGPQDIKNCYASASFLGDNVVIFNVKGNWYRLEVKVGYRQEAVIVIWTGTHAEYTKRHS